MKSRILLILVSAALLIGGLIWWKIDSSLTEIAKVDNSNLEEVISERNITEYLQEEELTNIQSNDNLQTIQRELTKEEMNLIALILQNQDNMSNHQILSVINQIIDRPTEEFSKQLPASENPDLSIMERDPAPEIPSTLNLQESKPISFVIVGKDTRKKGGSLNTDVIIVLVVDPGKQSVTLVSLPRDLRVNIPGYSKPAKINSAYAKGEIARIKASKAKKNSDVSGPLLLKKTVEGVLGIPIDYYVSIDFEGFIKTIDTLGGIQVNVDRRMLYHDPTDGTSIDLHPGIQVLSGRKALDFVRHRHDDRGPKNYSSDFHRNERQQQVLKAIAQKVGTGSGVVQVFSLLDVAGGHIRTDIPKDVLESLIISFIRFNPENVIILPTNAYWDRKSSFTIIPQDQLLLVKERLQRDMN
ncbi:LCP family protein [Brevibacillus sp. NPDC003359]|uniref:LCP family protein n=1 Tax=unclassified Brevibacillus TaxID=2684853 RepID=UPI0036C826BB